MDQRMVHPSRCPPRTSPSRQISRPPMSEKPPCASAFRLASSRSSAPCSLAGTDVDRIAPPGPAAIRSAYGSVLDEAARAVWPAADELVAQLGRSLTGAEDELARRDFERAARQIVERVLQAITDQLPNGIDPLEVSRAVGEECARRQLGLAATCAVAQAAADQLWFQLNRAIGAGNRAASGKLALEAGRYWRCVAGHVDALRAGYRRRSSASRPPAGDATPVPDGSLRELLIETARMTTHDSSIMAVAILGRFADDEARTVEEGLRRAGLRSAWRGGGQLAYGVVVAGPAAADTVLPTLTTSCAGRVGTTPPMPFAKARDAVSIATWTARSLPAGRPGVASAEDRLAAVLIAAAPAVAPLLINRSVGALLGLPAAERRDLLRTVSAVTDADGSPSEASKQLFCHRNTVMYRLRRIRLLTGRGVDTSEDKLSWTLGLLALAIHSEAEHQPVPAVAGPLAG